MIGILLILIQLVIAVYLFYYIISFISGAPFVPSSQHATETMIRMAKIKSGMKIYDLGSGDGRILLSAAQNGAMAVGYELNPILVLFSLLRSIISRNKNHIYVYWKSFWKADVGDADIIFVYLLPARMKKLQKKLSEELRPGTRIISNSFIFPAWPVIEKNTQDHIFVFQVPEKVQ